jgi:hypothetical protein
MAERRHARERNADARILAELGALLEPRSEHARAEVGRSPEDVLERALGGASERWDDGHPKGWPTLQLRVRGRPFDVYCEDPSDVTLDGIGIPVVSGYTVSREHLKRGWYDSREPSAR